MGWVRHNAFLRKQPEMTEKLIRVGDPESAEDEIVRLHSIVSAVAKQYGGGGHRNSSGFSVSFAQAQAFELLPDCDPIG